MRHQPRGTFERTRPDATRAVILRELRLGLVIWIGLTQALRQILRQHLEASPEDAVSKPFLKTTMAGLMRRIATGQVCPASPRPQYPEDTIQDSSSVLMRAAPAFEQMVGCNQRRQ